MAIGPIKLQIGLRAHYSDEEDENSLNSDEFSFEGSEGEGNNEEND